MAKKNTISYGLDREYLKTCTIFGKARMDVNKKKSFSVNVPSKTAVEDYEIEM